MKHIDMSTWNRREHFNVFHAMDYPHFNICAPVDISATRSVMQERGGSMNLAIVYVLARAANDLPSFRLRIRGDTVVEHEHVRPSITVLGDEDLFSFCTIPWSSSYETFRTEAEMMMSLRQKERVLVDEPGEDDLLFMSGIPWVAFTSIVHPIHIHPADSIPRVAWGKFADDGAQIKLPLSVQVHHGLMDGVHVGRYFERVEELFDLAAEWL